MITTAETIEAVAAELGLTIKTTFVPCSQSRSAKEKQSNLNWKVTVCHRNRDILTTDYSAGCAHCPSYKKGDRSIVQAELIAWECEHGYPARYADGMAVPLKRFDAKPITSKTADVLHSLVIDAEAVDYGDFESWCNDLGYDPDSRKAEATYNACLKIGLKLLNALGTDGLQRLRKVCQDY